ncbi:hypothetical protein [Actinomadura gamaensis]|uniref:DUF998 domain-containing protein n=1 Tax=Actinomadura gamaensis TaxID=1763541 RepID=A0ABV9TV77_9ACTN
MRRVLPAVCLFFLSPIVGEMLLGATSIDAIGLIPMMALLYGGGTLLIREVVRRTRRGWCSILLLGAAYALLEEGLLDQMIFNGHYSGNYDMVHVTYVPFLGTGVFGLLSVLAVHGVWSVTVPIALMEGMVPDRADEPWLGRAGLAVTAALFGLGIVIVGGGTYSDTHFMAPWPELAGTAAAIVLLVVAVFRIRRPGPGRADRNAPRPLVAGAASLVLTSAFMIVLQANWWGVGAALAVAVVALALGLYWSRARGWGRPHVFALAAGATLTYVWDGFGQTPDEGSGGAINLAGHVLLAVASAVFLYVAAKRVRKRSGAERLGSGTA